MGMGSKQQNLFDIFNTSDLSSSSDNAENLVKQLLHWPSTLPSTTTLSSGLVLLPHLSL